ncbi:FliH/SctL family protein [Piscinibacter sp.]|uniref:FliH/SctL family protein n=1 Tax=Piscinibacter sp. TaxID=1903157 RepID=UPI002C69A9F8|nr:FliH/SctL family protein [Albitalea sp.]HUG25739.1 FliH/SctL family protein [Albitalea sp.]
MTKKPAVKNVPPPEGGKTPSPYARFIPREELGAFASWDPGSLSGGGVDRRQGVRRAEPPAPEPPPAPDLGEQLHAARQSGYQDGYRDGLAALEGFKLSFASQMTAQIGQLTQSYGQELDALQQDMARALAVSATHLARQIVRSELAARPELVAVVAQEALDTLLMSARQISVRVHPDDHPLVAQGAAEALSSRGARLLGDASIARGGCLVESDIGVIDASVAARWKRAVASLGCEEAWTQQDPRSPDEIRGTEAPR